ncbi:MAG TPA: AraC family ligand binding domain-containing protein, partial [Clostridia bacterium]
MLYQETFQSGENPSEISVSSYIYINGKLEDNMITVGFPDHCHSYFEIQYFFSGSGETRIDGKPIRTVPNSLYLIPPLHVHGQSGHERMVNLVIQFSHNFLSSNAFAWKKNSTLLPAGEMKKNGIIMV